MSREANWALIELHSVTFAYDDGTPVFDKFSLTLEEGSFLCVVGPSGVGKTTLIRLLLGLERPGSGSILIDGLDPESARKRGRFSFMPQHPSLLPWMSVMENVRLPLKMRSHESSDHEIEQLLEVVELKDAINKRPRELSGGMQARAALARAWADSNAPLLLLDEPFASLDEIRREELGSLLKKLWKSGGKTIIYVTHNLSEAILLGTHILPIGVRGSNKFVEPIEISNHLVNKQIEDDRTSFHDFLRGYISPHSIGGYKSVLERLRADGNIDILLWLLNNEAIEVSTRVEYADVLKEFFVKCKNEPSTVGPKLIEQTAKTLKALWKAANDTNKVRLAFRIADFFPDESAEIRELFEWLSLSGELLFITTIRSYIENESLLEHATKRIERSYTNAAKRLQILSLIACEEGELKPALEYLKYHKNNTVDSARKLEPTLTHTIDRLTAKLV